MISFRYHIVTIVSVFLALAVGIALGSGPLKGEVDNSLVTQVKKDRQAKDDLRAQISDLRTANRFGDAYASQGASAVLAGKLAKRPVSVMVLPGAPESTVTGVTGFVKDSGGSLAGTYRVGKGLVETGNKQLVDELGSQLLPGAKDVTVPEDASGYVRMGSLIGRAIGTGRDTGEPLDDTSNSILSGLNTAGLMSADGQSDRRGSLVLVVAGSGSSDAETARAANSIVTSLVAAIDDATDGVVVAGPTSAARENGLVRAVRNDVSVARDVSTVDTVGHTPGQVVSVLALAQQAAGEAGHYGAVSAADGAYPGAPPEGQ